MAGKAHLVQPNCGLAPRLLRGRGQRKRWSRGCQQRRRGELGREEFRERVLVEAGCGNRQQWVIDRRRIKQSRPRIRLNTVIRRRLKASPRCLLGKNLQRIAVGPLPIMAARAADAKGQRAGKQPPTNLGGSAAANDGECGTDHVCVEKGELSDADACPRRDPLPDGNGNGDAVGYGRTEFRLLEREAGTIYTPGGRSKPNLRDRVPFRFDRIGRSTSPLFAKVAASRGASPPG